MKETKTVEQFKQMQERLADKQNSHRDEFLENVEKGNYEVAEKNYKELQTVSMAIQLCNQSIMRANDIEANAQVKKHEESRKAIEENLAQKALEQMNQPTKSKGIFSFLRGGKS